MAEGKTTLDGPGPGPTDEEVRAVLDELVPAGRCASGPPGTSEDNLIGLLQEVQDRFGYLPPAALAGMSRRLRTPLSRIYGVVSFYAQFYTEPRGRYTVRCCRGTACHVKGADRIIDAVRRTLGIEEGQTTPDMLFYLETVACLGTCFLAPAMMIDNQYYGKLVPQRVKSVLNSYQAKD